MTSAKRFHDVLALNGVVVYLSRLCADVIGQVLLSFAMNFILFFGGLSVLIGSFMIVCMCKQCKRRKMKQNGTHSKFQQPTVAYVIEKDDATSAYLNSLRMMESPMLHRTMLDPVESYRARVSSKDSYDSACEFLYRTYSTPNLLEPPKNSKTGLKKSDSLRVIPAIYIDSVYDTASNV